MNKLLLVALLFPLLIASQETITISGYLEEAENGEKLIGASILDLKSLKGTLSNDFGFYSITLPKDSIHLRISFSGLKTQYYKGLPNKNLSLNLKMESQLLDEVEIVASQEQVHQSSQMSSIDLSMQKVKTLPALLGENDIMKVIQLLPGVQSGSEGSSGLYVRGGGPDQNLILLDGVPVYNASHLFGFFSVFNADAIKDVKLIKGGFPARYGGRLSSVIDIKMKDGNSKEFHGEGSVGLIASKLTLEGPIIKDKTSFILSARRTYIDLLAQPLIKASNNGSSGGYYFYDLNGKINHKISDKDRIFISSYFGNDKAYTRFNDDWVDNSTQYREEGSFQLKWGNIINAIRWNHLLSDKLFMNTTLRYSRYKFLIGVDSRTIETVNNISTEDFFSFAYHSGIEDWSGKIDFDYIPNPNNYIKFGFGNIYHTFSPGVNQFIQTSATSAIDTSFGDANHYAHEFTTYLEDEFKLGSKIKGNLGLHFSGFIIGNKTYTSLQPRFSGRYLLDDNSSIKTSFASMTQYLHLLTNSGIGMPTDLWLPATERVAPQTSNQIAIGYARTFLNKFELSLEGYYKTMNNLIEYKDGASFFNSDENWQDKIEIGKGWSYGGELLLEKKLGKTTGWIGYTLSWTDRQFENLNFGEIYPYRYDRRHDIGIAITHEISDNINFGIVWVYGTGNAVTLGLERYTSVIDYNSFMYGDEIIHIGSRNNYRMPSYHRLDISISFKKQMSWGERTWSFGLYNAYNRQNPFYLDFAYDNNNNMQLYQYSLFPIIPSFNYAFKF